VTIDRQGYLRDVKITDHSGVGYLDDEAERAFVVAAPFLYPPQELFDKGDEFSFTFAFHLYLDRGFSFGFDWNNE
jgi:outer membrane biosynthesis protein TonB